MIERLRLGRRLADRLFGLGGALTALVCCAVVAYLGIELLRDGLTHLDSEFLSPTSLAFAGTGWYRTRPRRGLVGRWGR